MLKLSLTNGNSTEIAADVEELRLDAPLELYRDLPSFLLQTRRLKRLRIKIHHARHAAYWPYGDFEPCKSLDFLRNLHSLEELELYYFNKLSDGWVLRDLPNFRGINIGFKTRFDLDWLNSFAMEKLSVGLIGIISNHGKISAMKNLRSLGVENVEGDDLSVLRNLSKLEFLGIGGRVKSLAGVGGATSLHTLIMEMKFQDYGDFDQLRKLVKIRLQSCYDFASLEPLHAPDLKELVIYGSKSRSHVLESIKPLVRSQKLEKFIFGGIINDADVTPLLTLSQLRDCLIRPCYKDAIVSGLTDPSRLGVFRW
jgi:hypothetical protein